MTTRSVILNWIPWIAAFYAVSKSFFALVGVGVSWFFIWYGYENYFFELSLGFILFLHGVLMVLQAYYLLRKKSPTQAKEMPVDRSFYINEGGDVIRSASEVMEDLEKASYTADTWRHLAKKYQGKDYRGAEWKKIRMYCLNKAKSSDNIQIIGNEVIF